MELFFITNLIWFIAVSISFYRYRSNALKLHNMNQFLLKRLADELIEHNIDSIIVNRIEKCGFFEEFSKREQKL